MPKHTTFVPAVVILWLFCYVPPTPAGDTVDAIILPVGTLTISAPRGIQPRRAPVPFPHSRHFDFNCKTCHHKWDGFVPVRSCAATDCHDRTTSVMQDNPQVGPNSIDVGYYKNAYHKRCIACHRRLFEEREEQAKKVTVIRETLPRTGPTGCIGCHPRD